MRGQAKRKGETPKSSETEKASKPSDNQSATDECRVMVTVEDARFKYCLGKRGVVREINEADLVKLFLAGVSAIQIDSCQCL